MLITTVSDWQVNRFLDHVAQYKWARSSQKAKKVDSLKQDSLEKVSVFKEQALYGKEQAKRRTQEKVIKSLDHH